MKKFIALTLAVLMVFSFAACGGEGATQSGETKVEKNYPDNILMDPYGSGGNVFFNFDISNDSIETVTFLDTLADMPSDAWDVSKEKNGSVMAWVTDGVNLYIAGEGGVTASTCNYLFGGYRNLKSVNFNDCFYTDLVDRTTEMFVYCESLETLDLSGWNTSNVKYMSDTFHGCTNLKSVNLSGWDTSNVEHTVCMFADCFDLETVDVSHFDTSKMKSYGYMFEYCKSLTSVDLSNWNTDSVLSMEGMFKGCKNLTSVGDLKIPEGCDTTDMYSGTPLA